MEKEYQGAPFQLLRRMPFQILYYRNPYYRTLYHQFSLPWYPTLFHQEGLRLSSCPDGIEPGIAKIKVRGLNSGVRRCCVFTSHKRQDSTSFIIKFSGGREWGFKEPVPEYRIWCLEMEISHLSFIPRYTTLPLPTFSMRLPAPQALKLMLLPPLWVMHSGNRILQTQPTVILNFRPPTLMVLPFPIH